MSSDYQMVPVLVNLGSNIAPEMNIHSALDMLSEKVVVLRISSIWQSAAVGSSGPDYLNAAVLLNTDRRLEQFRAEILSAIESDLGRVRSNDKYRDRTIDLDVVIYDGIEIDPELWTQAHVAVPASQLMPRFKNQQTGEPLLEAASRLKRTAELVERPELAWPASTRTGAA